LFLSFQHIKPLLQTGTNRSSRFFSYAGLGIGVLLLLCSIQMYVNIQQLLGKDAPRKNGYDFIPIRKNITNETMGQLEKNLFTQKDIDELKSKPFVDDVAPLLANNFRVQLSGGSLIPFVSDFFLEALDNNFIDTVPPSFSWQEGQEDIPIIIASDFLEIYNVFAPGYGLPQLSEETATSMGILVICYAPDGTRQTFRGRIVALSDRINSFLVPISFMNWANANFGNVKEVRASRLYIKTKDANSSEFLGYLQEKNFQVNKDKTKFGRVKLVLQGIFSGLGVFGLLVVVLALLLFSFYLQLMIARSKDSLQLLLTLGYSPRWLSKKVSQQFIPVYIMVVLVALALTQLMQFAFQRFVLLGRSEISPFVHWTVLATALVLILLSIFTNYRMVRSLLLKLY
jgi:hypothetical protein